MFRLGWQLEIFIDAIERGFQKVKFRMQEQWIPIVMIVILKNLLIMENFKRVSRETIHLLLLTFINIWTTLFQ